VGNCLNTVRETKRDGGDQGGNVVITEWVRQRDCSDHSVGGFVRVPGARGFEGGEVVAGVKIHDVRMGDGRPQQPDTQRRADSQILEVHLTLPYGSARASRLIREIAGQRMTSYAHAPANRHYHLFRLPAIKRATTP